MRFSTSALIAVVLLMGRASGKEFWDTSTQTPTGPRAGTVPPPPTTHPTPVPTPKPTFPPTEPPTSPPLPKPTPRPTGMGKPTPEPSYPYYCGEVGDMLDAPGPLVNRIFDIQGDGLKSRFAGQTVFNVPAVVTAAGTLDDRFFLQDPDGGDKNDATSDGIEAFNIDPENAGPTTFRALGTRRDSGSVVVLLVGDRITVVQAVVDEWLGTPPFAQSTTYLVATPDQIIIESRSFALPDPIVIGEQGRRPPTQGMEAGIRFWESLQGMLVEIKDPIAISPTTSSENIYVVPDSGLTATGLSVRGTLNVSPHDWHPERIIVGEEDVFGFFFPKTNVGTKFSSIVGVVDDVMRREPYEVLPVIQFGISEPSDLQESSSTCAGSQLSMPVATYNIAGSLDYDTIAAHVVNNLGFPDIVAFQGLGASFEFPLLLDAISNVPSWQSNGQDAYKILRGNNRNFGIMYNFWRIQLDMDKGPQVQVDSFFRGQVPQVALFTFLPAKKQFDLINVRFTTKSGAASSFGVNQPFEELQEFDEINAGLNERFLESNGVRELILGGTTDAIVENPDSVIVLGGFYENEWVSPLLNLERAGLKNLVDDIPDNERYSVIREGISQAWDHILVSRDLCPGTFGEYIHVNVEFFEQVSRFDPMIGCINFPFEEYT